MLVQHARQGAPSDGLGRYKKDRTNCELMRSVAGNPGPLFRGASSEAGQDFTPQAAGFDSPALHIFSETTEVYAPNPNLRSIREAVNE